MEESPGKGAESGAVSFLHRLDASPNPHFHYHLCVLDGVYEAAEKQLLRYQTTAHAVFPGPCALEHHGLRGHLHLVLRRKVL